MAMISIAAILAVLSLLLVVTDFAERRILAEPVLIARVAQARKLSPEYAEAFVAMRAERMLGARD